MSEDEAVTLLMRKQGELLLKVRALEFGLGAISEYLAEYCPPEAPSLLEYLEDKVVVFDGPNAQAEGKAFPAMVEAARKGSDWIVRARKG